jgi:hypothetical protein
MEEHRGQTKGEVNVVPIQARGQPPIITIVRIQAPSARGFPRRPVQTLELRPPIPNNYTVPEGPIRGGPERRRRIASANPQKP